MERTAANKSLLDKIWDLDPVAIGGLKGRGVRLLQFVTFAAVNFFDHESLLRATALSFTTLLSLVPLLALAFSVLKGLGAQNRLAPLIIQHMAAGSEVVVNRIITYIGNTNMRSVGAIGLAALLYTSISMLANIENAFNAIWGVSETRSFYRKFSDYLSVLVSAPLLLLAATSITTTLQSERLVAWLIQNTYVGDVFLFLLGLAPYLTVWIAIFVLYLFMPNTRVRYTSAMIGAVLAGTLWELAQWVFIHFQVGAGNYNAIYGTLAALPILMIWIYVSWIIVLFGMEVVAAHQSRRTFRRDIRGGILSQALKEVVALAALRHVAVAFHNGEPPWTEEHLAVKLRMPLRAVREVLQPLVDGNFLVRAGTVRGGLYPARELDQLSLDGILLSLRGHGAACKLGDEERALEIVDRVDRAVAASLQGLTLKDLACRENLSGGVDKEGGDDL